MRSKQKKRLLFASSLLLLLVTVFANTHKLPTWAQGILDPDSAVVPTVLKDHVTNEDIIPSQMGSGDLSAKRKANVLFLIDTSNAMVFSPRGKIPSWNTLLAENGNNATRAREKANEMTKECTYGIGGRPAKIAQSYGNSTITSRLEGRDVDPSNNIPGDPDNYYSADPTKPFQLTFITENLANETGPSIPSHTPADLMPNDSRMYQMKLIFMRLLKDTENLNKMRFALATTHVSQTNGSGGHIFYRVPNFDATTQYPNGSLYGGFDRPSGAATNTNTTQNRQWAISTAATNEPQGSLTWLTVKRAFLRVPFGENTDEHRKKFSMLMDGIEDNTPVSGGLFAMKNPEITTSGEANMGTAIFMAYATTPLADTSVRTTLINNKLIYYSRRNASTTRVQTDGQSGRHIFAAGSGEAAGSVLDFFSPPIDGKGFDSTAKDSSGYTPYDAPASNFPISDPCDPNYLVILTAGDNVNSAYKSSKAVEHLYHYTKNEDVAAIIDRNAPPSSTNVKKVRLQTPIRTMVIGFVDPNDNDPKIVALREELNLMADYGSDGIKNHDPINGIDPDGKAYFANNVPELMAALAKIIGTIVAEVPDRTVASTKSLIAPNGSDFEGFQVSFKPSSQDQWAADFKYITIDSQGVPTIRYSLQEEFAAYAKQAIPSGRRLLAWNASDKKMEALSYPTNLTNPVLSDLSKVSDAFDNNKTFPTEGNKLASTLLLRWYFGQDYDASIKSSFPRTTVLSDTGNSGYTLMKQIAESRIHAQPGYGDWLGEPEIKNRPKTLFFHTNDGLLHAIDPALSVNNSTPWARERWAFIPPNVLVGERLLGLKFKINQSEAKPGNKEYLQTATWISSSGDTYRSNAAYTTDGSVYLYNLPDAGSWKTILIGSMGRGGAGLYALDVTNPANVETLKKSGFLWAIENDLTEYNTKRTPTQSQHGSGNWGEVHMWNSIAPHYKKTPYSNASTTDFDRLGYNAPAPLVGTTRVLGPKGGPKNVAVLVGGMQYDLNLDKNGLFGSSVYVFDPLGKIVENESIIYKSFVNGNIESADLKAQGSGMLPQGVGTPNPVMGMMLTPPTAITEVADTKYLTGYVTADNRGQIFEGSFLSPDEREFCDSPAKWSLRRVATLRDPENETNADENFPIPHVMPLLRDGSTLWIFGGTADVVTRKIGENIFAQSPRIGVIARKADSYGRGLSHYLFGFKRPKYGVPPLILRDATGSGTENPKSRSEDVLVLNPQIKAMSIDQSLHKGWIIPLARGSDSSPASLREYTSAPVGVFSDLVLFKSDLFAATFVPNKPIIDDKGSSGCDTIQSITVNGVARLYALNARTGGSGWYAHITSTKYATYKGIKIHGMTMVDFPKERRLFMNVSIVDKDRFKPYEGRFNVPISFADNKEYELTDAIYHNASLISIGEPKGGGGGYDSLPKKDAMKLNYWREVFVR